MATLRDANNALPDKAPHKITRDRLRFAIDAASFAASDYPADMEEHRNALAAVAWLEALEAALFSVNGDRAG